MELETDTAKRNENTRKKEGKKEGEEIIINKRRQPNREKE